jgi:acyl carrier protein
MSTDTAPDNADPLVNEILDLFAREARVDRQLLQPDVRADALGVSSLDLTLALFELEDRFDIQLPDVMGGGSTQPTVGDLVQQVLDAIRRREVAAATASASAAG